MDTVGIGTIVGIIMLIIAVVITFLLTGDRWRFNTSIDPVYIFIIFLSSLWSSIVQEFVFRGYPFQTSLQHYTVWKAQLFITHPFAYSSAG